jgi:hypothetical protein
VRFSTKGVQKHPQNKLRKVQVKNFLSKTFCQKLFAKKVEKNTTKLITKKNNNKKTPKKSGFPRLFTAFLGRFSARESKNTTKLITKKNNRLQKNKTMSGFPRLFIARLRRFSARECKNTAKLITNKKTIQNTKYPKSRVSLDFYCVFGAFLRKGAKTAFVSLQVGFVLRLAQWLVLVRAHRSEYPRRAWVYRHRLLSGVLVSLYLLHLLHLQCRHPSCSSHQPNGLPS